ncbi:acyltransferase [Chitinibacter fontanus]|uniref:Acyltransferase n=1 Tax=Chitinibacter fontanus TaxID=1737446 RepID=A0A7D5VA78_9NEIS|nr:acyltransferase [Chitinibacter fontanus]QLI81979.1 acyltransferase [Chitinibacter fontanus]
MTHKHGHFDYLDGVRGIAAFSVTLHHFFYAFLPALIWGAAGNKGLIFPQFEMAVAQTPLNLLWSGDFAVMVFFVMSAFVLTYRFFRDQHDPNFSRVSFLTSATLRRYPRLVLPIFAASLLVLVVIKMGGLFHQAAAQFSLSFEWLALQWDTPKASLLDVLRNSFLEVPFKPEPRYNNVLWTICIEFYGSLLAFAMVATLGRQSWRAWAYLALGWYFGNSPYLCFVMGVALADFIYAPSAAKACAFLSRPATYWTFAIAGLYLGSFPKGIDTSQNFWFSWLYWLDGGAMPNAQWTHNWGALFLLIAVLHAPSWQSNLSRQPWRWLGRISFSMYLMHGLFLGSICSWLIVKLVPSIGYAAAFFITLAVYLFAMFGSSHLFARYIDEISVKFSRQAYTWLVGNKLDALVPRWTARWRNSLFVRQSWAYLLFAIVLLYVLLYAALKQSWFSHSGWDSYILQAQAWWQGRTMLAHDYPYLELAIFHGQYYVSFPPIPTIPQFLLFPFFGEGTPNHFLNSCYTILSFALLTYWFNPELKPKGLAIPLAAVFGSNLLAISLNGGVWFQAQVLAYLFTTVAFFFAVKSAQRPWAMHLAALSLALAVGCRPFQLVYFPALLWILAYHLGHVGTQPPKAKTSNGQEQAEPLQQFLLFPLLIGGALAWYNWLRFGNPLEFGHNYLPEFQRATEGQFSLSYIPQNFMQSLRLPSFTAEGGLTFPRTDGVMFFLVNPVFLILARKLGQLKREFWQVNGLLFGAILLHMLSTWSHRTMGGWQFGNRYFVDMIPAVVLLLWLNRCKFDGKDLMLALFGIGINVYGALWLYLNWP